MADGSISAVQRATTHLALLAPTADSVRASVVRNDLETLKQLLNFRSTVIDCFEPSAGRPQLQINLASRSEIGLITDLYDFGGNAAAIDALSSPRKAALHNTLRGNVESPLLMRAAAGRPDAVPLLLAAAKHHKINPAINEQGCGGYTALHMACNAPCVHSLLAGGASVNARSAAGSTPLMKAAQYGRVASALTLLLAGADVNASTKHVHDAVPVRNVLEHTCSTAQLQAPRVWLPAHPMTAVMQGRQRCKRLLQAVMEVQSRCPQLSSSEATKKAWVAMCIHPLRTLCKQPLAALAAAFDTRAPRAHKPAGSDAAAASAAQGQTARLDAALRCNVPSTTAALTPGQIVAHIVVFEFLGPWCQSEQPFDCHVPEHLLRTLLFNALLGTGT